MGRIYTAQFNGQAETVAQDAFELVAPADSVVIVHSIELSQSTEVADAAEEMLTVTLKSGQTVSGSGGATTTPVPVNFGDAAAGAACETNNTTQASTGTIVTHAAWDWNIRGEFIKIWTPETRPVLSPSRRMTVDISAPADSVTFSGTLIFEEIGG